MDVSSDGVPGAVAPARVQARSRDTRHRLLEAAVECLVEYGWSGTTTTLVGERAGVSRGAQLHHYPSKADLVTAAVQHLAERRTDELRAEVAALPPGGGPDRRVDLVVDLLATLFTGPLFAAALELWVAARTDPPLRDALLPFEASLGRQMHRLAVDLLDADESRPDVREAVQATLDLMRGLGVANLLTEDAPRRAGLLALWKRHLADILRDNDTPERTP